MKWDWAVSCRSKKHVMRTESRMDIEEIVKMKLDTIKEEPDETSTRVEVGPMVKHRSEVRKAHVLIKTRRTSFTLKWRIKQSYVVFMNGFASKGGISGLPRY